MDNDLEFVIIFI